jgi:hypothetical protein
MLETLYSTADDGPLQCCLWFTCKVQAALSIIAGVPWSTVAILIIRAMAACSMCTRPAASSMCMQCSTESPGQCAHDQYHGIRISSRNYHLHTMHVMLHHNPKETVSSRCNQPYTEQNTSSSQADHKTLAGFLIRYCCTAPSGASTTGACFRRAVT